MKNRVLAAAAALLAVGLTGCSSGSSQTDSSQTNSTQPEVSTGGSSTPSGSVDATSPAPVPTDKGPITYAGSGGAAGDVIAKEIEKFEQQTGVKVNYVQGTTSVNYAKVLAQKANPQIDVLLVNPSDLLKGSAMGLFEPMNEKLVPAIADLYEATPASKYGVPQHLAAEGFAYNTEEFQKAGIPPLTSLADLSNPKLKGRVALSPPNGNFGINALVMFAIANGGSADNVKPGFEALKKLKNSGNWALTPESSAAGDALMSQGSAWVNYTSTTHAAALATQGLPIAFVSPKETGGVIEISDVAAVANTKHLEASFALINFLISPEVQESQAVSYAGPVNKLAKLTPEVAKTVPYGEEELKSLLQLDEQKVAANKSQWVADWHRELG